MSVLSLADARQHEAEVRQAIRDELERWVSLGDFERYPRAKATVLDSRWWVLQWKMVDGDRIINARQTARRYTDAQAGEVSNLADTAARRGHRLINVAHDQWQVNCHRCQVGSLVCLGERVVWLSAFVPKQCRGCTMIGAKKDAVERFLSMLLMIGAVRLGSEERTQCDSTSAVPASCCATRHQHAQRLDWSSFSAVFVTGVAQEF